MRLKRAKRLALISARRSAGFIPKRHWWVCDCHSVEQRYRYPINIDGKKLCITGHAEFIVRATSGVRDEINNWNP